MTTKRKQSKATARSGINYVRTVVEKCNCIFHEIQGDNDIGNDAHLEFIEREEATGCLIAVQVKSGQSYFGSSDEYTDIQSDKNHFEYWSSHSLPVVMIVYHPGNNVAAWCDITEFLMQHPERVDEGPYTIRVRLSHVFDETTFASIYRHFLRYRDLYRQESYFGRALRDFADVNNAEACFDGLFSLFSYHRNRAATWYYLISCFRNFADHPILRDLIGILCHIPGHPDIFWHRKNIIESAVQREARNLLASHFARQDVVLLFSQIDENGIARGTIGQAVHAIVDILTKRDVILESIAFDSSVDGESRYWALVLLADYEQQAREGSADVLLRYLASFPNDEHSDLVRELLDNVRWQGGFTLY